MEPTDALSVAAIARENQSTVNALNLASIVVAFPAGGCTLRKASSYIEREEQMQQTQTGNKTVSFPQKKINIFTNNSLSEALTSAIKQSVAHS